MGLLYRIKQSNPMLFSRRFSQLWVQILAPNQLSRSGSPPIVDGVRFFAASAQGVKKEAEKVSKGPRMNEQVTEQILRLVIDERHGIVPTHIALQRARSLKMDLVEVARNDELPVCKIIDYHREKYKQELKGKEKVKSGVTLRKGECKEVRFTAKTELKDLKMKADTVKRLMERGYRVKCVALGKEGQDLEGLLSRLSDLIEDVAFIESGPKLESKQAHLIVRHIKFGSPKKSGKKGSSAEEVATTTSVIQNASPSSNTSPYSDSIESSEEADDEDADESDSETLPNKSNELFASSPVLSQADHQMKVNPVASPSVVAPVFPQAVPSIMPDFPGPRASSSSWVHQETENRYKQKATSTGPRGMGLAKYQDHGIPLPGNNTSTQNSRLPRNGDHRSRIPGFVKGPKLHDSISSRIQGSIPPLKQEPGGADVRIPPPKGYGIFSAHGTDPQRGQGSRDDIKDRINDITSNSVPGTTKQNPPTSRSDVGEESSFSRGGRWGIFSADIPSSSGTKVSENQTKFRQ